MVHLLMVVEGAEEGRELEAEEHLRMQVREQVVFQILSLGEVLLQVVP